jgi:hypothetical protein
MTERCNTNLFEVLIGQIRQNEKADVVVGNRCAYCPRPSFSSQSVTCCIAASALNIGLRPPASARIS